MNGGRYPSLCVMLFPEKIIFSFPSDNRTIDLLREKLSLANIHSTQVVRVFQKQITTGSFST